MVIEGKGEGEGESIGVDVVVLLPLLLLSHHGQWQGGEWPAEDKDGWWQMTWL